MGGTRAGDNAFAQLLSGPRCGWMFSHRDVDDAATFVRQDHQDEQEAARRGGGARSRRDRRDHAPQRSH